MSGRILGIVLIISLVLSLGGCLREGPERSPQSETPAAPESPRTADGETEQQPNEGIGGRAEAQGSEEADEADEEPSDGGSESSMRILQSGDFARLYPHVILRSGNPNHPYVALTFDDGPDDQYTPQILDILKRHGVKGTFFFIGTNIRKHPDVVKRAHEEGHLIASHGYTHANFANLEVDEIEDSLQRSTQVIEEVTGESNRLFRPPYAALNSRAIEAIEDAGYKIILWNVDSLDWKSLPEEEVMGNVLPAVSSGSIVLQHSSGGPGQDLSGTVQALDQIIEVLSHQGYEMVTVDRLLELDGEGRVTTWYTVQPGDTLAGIAARYRMPLRQLMELNPGVDPNFIYVGQRLVVSGVPHPVREPTPESGTYTVEPGDTIWKVSNRFGLSAAALRKLNPTVAAANLPVGYKLQLVSAPERIYHTITKGESLWSISRTYGIAVDELQTLNPLLDPHNLRAGQRLRLR